jgi:hypothetical protein
MAISIVIITAAIIITITILTITIAIVIAISRLQKLFIKTSGRAFVCGSEPRHPPRSLRRLRAREMRRWHQAATRVPLTVPYQAGSLGRWQPPENHCFILCNRAEVEEPRERKERSPTFSPRFCVALPQDEQWIKENNVVCVVRCVGVTTPDIKRPSTVQYSS